MSFRSTPTILLALCLVPLFALSAAGSAGAQERTAVVVSTSSVGGETISCGCQKKELGGIARRAAVIEAQRAKNPAILLVDAGDFGSHVDFKPWMRTEFQVEMMGKMGYDAVTLGPNELLFGVERIRSLMATVPSIRVVSANVTDKSGTRLWDDFVVVEKGGVKFAVTGVTDGAFYDFALSRGSGEKNEFAFEDMRASLLRVLPRMREQADVVVALLHTGSGDAKRLLDQIDGIDIAVVGHGPVYKFSPETVGKTLLVQAGSRGQYLGVTELTLSEGGVSGHSGVSQALGDTVTPQPVYHSLVSAFNSKYDAMAEKANPPKPEKSS